MSSHSSRWSRIVEFFLLRETSRRSARIPMQTKLDAQRILGIAVQTKGASETLWEEGYPSASLRLAFESFHAFVEAADELDRGLASATEGKADQRFASLEMRDSERREIEEVLALSQDCPKADRDIQGPHKQTYKRLMHAQDLLHGALEPLIWTQRGVGWQRIRRSFLALCGLSVALGSLFFVLHALTKLEVSASGEWSSEFGPASAIDGDTATEWLLPDRSTGFIDVDLRSSKTVRAVRLVNSRNRHNNDRGARDYRVELWSRDGILKSVSGTFPKLSLKPEWVTIDVGADGVRRVRIYVDSWHDKGGGLAEIEVVR